MGGVKKTLDPLPPPTHHIGGWVRGGGTHVALFTCTVFHINLFQLGYYMSVCYNKIYTKNSIQVAQPGYWLKNWVARIKVRWPRFNIYLACMW